MRSSSSDRRRPWNAPPPKKPAEPKQVVKLTVPTVSSDRNLTALHSRLSSLVSRITEFVNASCELLAAHHISSGGVAVQDKVLEELAAERGKWEQYTYYALGVQEDVLRKLSPQSLDTISGNLGTAVGDFKRVSQLVADTQNQITLAMRKAGRREDTSLNSRVWQVFTTLNQNIYEAFFRHRRSEDSSPLLRQMEDESVALKKQIRTLEKQLADSQNALRARDGESDRRAARDVEAFTKVEYVTQLESDLQHAHELASRLKSDLSARDFAIRELERRLKPPSHQLSPRGKPKPGDMLQRSSELSTVLRQPHPRREDQRYSEQSPDQSDTTIKRPSSVTPRDSRLTEIGAKEMEGELSREREKSRSFFNALKRKEKECDELYESLGARGVDVQLQEEIQTLKREKDELTKALTEARRVEQRQLTEVSQFAGVIKALERDKTKIEQEKAKLAKDFDSISELRGRLQEHSDSNEDLRKQLKLTIDEKHKLLKLLNTTKTELTKTAEGYTNVEKERDLLGQKADALTQEKELLLRKLAARHERSHEETNKDKAACQLAIAKVQGALEARMDVITENLAEKEERLNTVKSSFETKLREYEAIIREVNERTNAYESELQDSKVQCEEAEIRLQTSELDIEQLRLELNRCNQKCQKWESEYADLQSELQQKTEECDSLSSRLSQSLLHTKEKDALSQQVKYERETFEGESNRLLREVSELKEQIIGLQHQHVDEVSEANGQIERLQFQVKSEEKRRKVDAETFSEQIKAAQGREETANSQVEKLSARLEAILIDREAMSVEAKQQSAAKDTQLASLQSIVKAQEKEIQSLTSAKSDLEKELFARSPECEKCVEMRTELKEMQSRLHSEEVAKDQVAESLSETVNKLKEAKADNKSQASLAEKLRAELVSRKSEIEGLQEKLSAADQNQSDQSSLLKAKDSEIKAIDQEKHEILSQLHDVKADFEEFSTTAANQKESLLKTNEDLSRQISTLKSECERFSGQITEYLATIATLKSQQEAVTTSISEELTESLSAKDTALSSLKAQISTMEAEKSELEAQYEDVIQRLTSSEQARNQMEERLGELQEDKKQQASELNSLHKQIASLQQQQILALGEKKDLEEEAENLKIRLETQLTDLENSKIEMEKDRETAVERVKSAMRQQAETDLSAMKAQMTTEISELRMKETEFTTTIMQLKELLSAAEDAKAQLQTENIEANNRTTSLSDDLESIRSLLSEAQRTIQEKNGLILELQTRETESKALISALKTDLQEAADRVVEEQSQPVVPPSAEPEVNPSTESLQKDFDALSSSHQQLLEEYQQIQQLYTEQKESNDKLKSQLQHQSALLKQAKETDRHKLKGSDSAREHNSRRIDDLNVHISELGKQRDQLEASLLNALKELEKKKGELSECKDLLEQAKSANSGQSSAESEEKERKTMEETERNHRKQKELEDEITACKREIKQLNSSQSELKTIIAGKEESITVLNRDLDDCKKAMNDSKAANESALRTEIAMQVSALSQKMDETRKTFHEKVSSMDFKTSSLLQAALLCIKKYAVRWERIQSQNKQLFLSLQSVSEMFTRMDAFSTKLSERIGETDSKANRCVSAALQCIRNYGAKAESLKSKIKEKEADFSHIGEMCEMTDRKASESLLLIDAKMENIDNRASSLVAKSLIIVKRLAETKEAHNSTAETWKLGIETAISHIHTSSEEILHTISKKLEALNARVSTCLAKQQILMRTKDEEISKSTNKSREMVEKTTLKKQEIAAQMERFNDSMTEKQTQLANRIHILASKCAPFEKCIASAKLNSRFLSENFPLLLAIYENFVKNSLSTLSDCVSSANSRIISLKSTFVRNIAALKDRNQHLESILIDLESANSRQIEANLAIANRDISELRLANEELSARFLKSQSEYESKIQRLQRELSTRPLPIDTFSLIDIREEAEAAIESSLRKVNLRIEELNSKLSTVKRAYNKSQSRVLSVAAVKSQRIESSVAQRIAALETALDRVKAKVVSKLSAQKVEIGLLKGLAEAGKRSEEVPPMRGSEDSKKPFEASMHFDDSVEFISLEPTHRRGSSVNTSIDDMRQALSNLRVLKRVKHESQVWFLTVTIGDEPDFYWLREHELPHGDIASVPDAEDLETEAIKAQHLEVLRELAKTQSELRKVEDWLSLQGCDMSHMTVEMALNEVFHSRRMVSPRPRSPLHPISVELSTDVVIETSQTPKIGKDALIIPATIADQDFDSLLDTISQLESDKSDLAQQLEAQITSIASVVTKLQEFT